MVYVPCYSSWQREVGALALFVPRSVHSCPHGPTQDPLSFQHRVNVKRTCNMRVLFSAYSNNLGIHQYMCVYELACI